MGSRHDEKMNRLTSGATKCFELPVKIQPGHLWHLVVGDHQFDVMAAICENPYGLVRVQYAGDAVVLKNILDQF